MAMLTGQSLVWTLLLSEINLSNVWTHFRSVAIIRMLQAEFRELSHSLLPAKLANFHPDYLATQWHSVPAWVKSLSTRVSLQYLLIASNVCRQNLVLHLQGLGSQEQELTLSKNATLLLSPRPTVLLHIFATDTFTTVLFLSASNAFSTSTSLSLW